MGSCLETRLCSMNYSRGHMSWHFFAPQCWLHFHTTHSSDSQCPGRTLWIIPIVWGSDISHIAWFSCLQKEKYKSEEKTKIQALWDKTTENLDWLTDGSERRIDKQMVRQLNTQADRKTDIWHDEGLTLETSSKHHNPQAKNTPYQPLLIKPTFSVLAHAEKQRLEVTAEKSSKILTRQTTRQSDWQTGKLAARQTDR